MNKQMDLDQMCVKVMLSQSSQCEDPKQVQHSILRNSCLYSKCIFFDFFQQI